MSYVIIAYSILYLLPAIIVDILQIRHIQLYAKKEPVILNTDDYLIAANYALTQRKISFFSHIYDFIIMVFWLQYGILYLTQLYSQHFTNTFGVDWCVLMSFLGINFVIGLPFSIVQKRIDAIYGFNKQNFTSLLSDFLKGIIVQFDLTFSNKAWVEGERYHFLDFVSSQSTMHKITKFNLQEQCNRYVDNRIIDIVKAKINEYNRLMEYDNSHKKSIERKRQMDELYLEILYNVPAGFELTAGMTTNYQQLKTIYQQRRHHLLPDWQVFCDWCLTLPLFKELCIDRNK